MNYSNAQPIPLLGLLVLIGSLAGTEGFAAEPAGVILPQYHIYAGNTHSHTSNTWSHGEQYLKAVPEPGEGKAKAQISKTLKPDWQKVQGPPAAHYALAKSKGYDFYVTSDHSQEAAFQPPSLTNAAWIAARQASCRSHRPDVRGHCGI